MQALCYKLSEAIEQYNAMKQDGMLELTDALIKATLEEMWVQCEKRSIEYQKQYTLTLKATWAFALLEQWQGHHDSTHGGNLMHKLCCLIDKTFA